MKIWFKGIIAFLLSWLQWGEQHFSLKVDPCSTPWWWESIASFRIHIDWDVFHTNSCGRIYTLSMSDIDNFCNRSTCWRNIFCGRVLSSHPRTGRTCRWYFLSGCTLDLWYADILSWPKLSQNCLVMVRMARRNEFLHHWLVYGPLIRYYMWLQFLVHFNLLLLIKL